MTSSFKSEILEQTKKNPQEKGFENAECPKKVRTLYHCREKKDAERVA